MIFFNDISTFSCKPVYCLDLWFWKFRGVFKDTFAFQVLILETGEDKLLGIGATAEDYNTSHMLGSCKESVGYYADDGNIFHNGGFKETQGIKK